MSLFGIASRLHAVFTFNYNCLANVPLTYSTPANSFLLSNAVKFYNTTATSYENQYIYKSLIKTSKNGLYIYIYINIYIHIL